MTSLHPPSDRPEGRQAWLGLALITLAVVAAYAGTFAAPFVFDSSLVVLHNPSIRHLGTAFQPPQDGSTVQGRPLVNASLALNYAVSGTRPWSYHAFNLTLHLAAAWTLFGLLRRTAGGTVERARTLAFAVTLLWALHPLQTEAVTYVAQRAESQASLCYLLTLYCFVRGETGGRTWRAASVLACLAGMATKEIMVSAPVLVLAYDRTFLSGSFRAAWARRWQYYAALAATWGLLVFLVLRTDNRGGTAGLGTGVPWLRYLAAQVAGLSHYLRLALWPFPLVFDYGRTLPAVGWALLPSAAVLLLLLGGTLAGFFSRRPAPRALGFLGLFFFGILAPTALVPVATQTLAEHRMYLPLAAVLLPLFLGFERLCPKPRALALLGIALSLGAAAATYARNADYRSEIALWGDTVARRPDNDRAHNNLGNAYFLAGRVPEAAAQYEEALRLHPEGQADAEYNLANADVQLRRWTEAVAHGRAAVRLSPANPEAHQALGMALARTGPPAEAVVQFTEAIGQYEEVLKEDPEDARMRHGLALAHFHLANLLAPAGRMPEAIAHYAEALRFSPDLPEAELNWGNALFAEGEPAAAATHYRAALQLRPDYPEARYMLDKAGAPAAR